MNKYYQIKSGVLLDAVKKYIKDRHDCALAYSAFTDKYGAKSPFDGTTSYFKNSRCLHGVYMTEQLDGWTKIKSNGESHPKRGTDAYKEMISLPTMPNGSEIIEKITGVPLMIGYKTSTGKGSSCIGNPLNECGFLYMVKHDLYAIWVPDVKAIINEQFSDYEITNGADKWEMDAEGIEEISETKWKYLVAECKMKEEEGDE